MRLNEEKMKTLAGLRVNLPLYLKSWMLLEKYFRVTERRHQKDCPAFGFTHYLFLLNSVRGVAEALRCLSVHLLQIQKDSVLKVLVNERSYRL